MVMVDNARRLAQVTPTPLLKSKRRELTALSGRFAPFVTVV